jgi:hypothetical protein
MSDNVLIVLIITVAIIIVLFIFRDRLRKFSIKGGKDSVEANLETYKEKQTPTTKEINGKTEHAYGVNISGNKQIGKEHEIVVTKSNVNVSDNLQLGENDQIEVTRPGVNVDENVQLGKEHKIQAGVEAEDKPTPPPDEIPD